MSGVGRAVLAAAALAFCLAVALADPRDGAELLDDFLKRTPHAKIIFRQTSLDNSGRELSANDGYFWYKRPNLFRMEYAPPQQLLMVSDGETTWTYEEDLNQVLENSARLTEDSALLAVLSSGSLAALDGKYILSYGVGGKWRWATAEARDPDQIIRLLRLGFSAADGELQRVELTDAFGGVARLDIASIERGEMEDSIFIFAPPPNAEVVRANE